MTGRHGSGGRLFLGAAVTRDPLATRLHGIDIIYFPRETELLRKARALGAKALNGGTMTVLQAAGQFRLFANVEPDIERMLSDFEQIAAR